VTIYPAKTDFCRLAAQHNIVPVYTSLTTDMETPVTLYYKLVGDGEGFMLESAENNKTFGRYSFIGASPFAKFIARSSFAEIISRDKTVRIEGKPLPALQNFMDSFRFPDIQGLPPFIGGAVGYFAYESTATWERILGQSIPDDLIIAEFMVCDTLCIMDHLTHSTTLLATARIEPDADAETAYEKAVQELHTLFERLQQPVVLPTDIAMKAAHGEEDRRVVPGLDIKQRYCEMVLQAKEYIAAGDIFQVVLSQPFRQQLPKHPFALYRRLRQINPSPYMFYLNFGNRKLVGASPEMLTKLEGDCVRTFPIAGTRPRGKTAAEDKVLAADLLQDTKELAEHAMLVDLARNDLGRISIPGTVVVDRMMQVEMFSHVMHVVSEVIGRLDPQYAALDVLKACFPAGTVSGAPKVRAMEIINELEQDIRGPYAGAVGYLDFRGNMDTCITIRTLIIEGDEVIVRTGAGIVADSIPENEYQEVLNKAKVLFQILEEETGNDINH
jgi:anthranilate synthase component I